MDLQLKGKSVLITASSKGIGRAVAEMFIKENCKVAICSSNKINLQQAVLEIKKQYGIEPVWDVCDINNNNDIKNFVELVKKNNGPVDILVNNCGGPKPGFFEDLDDNNWNKAYEQVLMSAVRFTNYVLPDMKQNCLGRIVNITSISVKQPIENLILSNSLRSAVTSMAKTLSNKLGQYNITVNNVAPGYTLTGRLYELAVEKAKEVNESHEHILASMASDVPMRRLARPDEIASAVVFLASSLAGYITGQTLTVDGGLIKSAY